MEKSKTFKIKRLDNKKIELTPLSDSQIKQATSYFFKEFVSSLFNGHVEVNPQTADFAVHNTIVECIFLSIKYPNWDRRVIRSFDCETAKEIFSKVVDISGHPEILKFIQYPRKPHNMSQKEILSYMDEDLLQKFNKNKIKKNKFQKNIKF